MSTITRPRASEAKTGETTSAPVAVIDIGSNSIRLVCFAAQLRNPVAVFNEKVLAGLGRHIVSTGKLDDDAMARALESLKRFRAVIDQHRIEEIHAVATAAVREAANGPEFVDRASALCGVTVRVLPGEEEARLTALGVLSGIPDANGLVGDLGGGSLELLEVENGNVSQGATVPLGALRLLDLSKGKMAAARDAVTAALAGVAWLDDDKSANFYAVGGAWRTLARIQMARQGYGLEVLQHYVISRDEAYSLAHIVSSQSRKSLQQITQVPSRRIESLPYAAVVLESLLNVGKFKDVVISAYGLREGILFDTLPDAIKRQDPLVEGCHEMARRMCRVPELGAELFAWSMPLFAALGESEEWRRLREAASWLSGIAWRANPDQRGQIGFRESVYAPLGGIDHRQRLILGLTVLRRYEPSAPPQLTGRVPVLAEEEQKRAALVGSALRLGISLSGGARGVLGECPLTLGDKTVKLRCSPRFAGLCGESVQKRLNSLASLLGRSASCVSEEK